MCQTPLLAQLGGRYHDGGVGSNRALSLPDSLLSGKHPLLLSQSVSRALPHRYQFKIFVAFFLCRQTVAPSKLGTLAPSGIGQCRGFLTTASLEQNRTFWKQIDKYTTRPIGMKKTGGRDHTGKVLSHCNREMSRLNLNGRVWISIF